MEKKSNKILIAFVVFLLVVACIFGYMTISKLLNDKKSRDTYNQVATDVTTKKDTTDEEKPPIDIDWDELLSINKDVIGWIYVDSINVSYPIMKTTDNDYYLHRNIYQEYLYAGSIFLDMNNNISFNDPHSIIYGHNMIDGSMFGRLSQIPYQDAAKDNPFFWVLTPNGNYKYQMFAAFETNVTSDTYSFFVNEDPSFETWGNKMKSQSFIDFKTRNIQSDDYIVTLSTCSAAENTRMVVMGFCISEEKPER